MTEGKKKSLHEISVLLCEAYNELRANGQVVFPLTDEQAGKVDAIVKTVYSNYFGIERFPSFEEKASAFFCLIIKDHPFTDGNKRTATLWLETFCLANAIETVKEVPVDELAVSVENVKTDNISQIVKLVQLVLFGRN